MFANERLRRFQRLGTLRADGRELGQPLDLHRPVSNYLTMKAVGVGVALFLRGQGFGVLARQASETSHPLAFGMEKEAAASFVRSRAFKTVHLSGKGEGGREDLPAAPAPPVDVVVRYAKDNILMSGWALGEEKHIGGMAAMMRVQLGQGDVVLFGFRPQFRGQPRGTYKLFFNALHGATLDEMPAPVRTDTATDPSEE